MPPLFVALPLPDDVAGRLVLPAREFAAVRRTSSADMHITLHFIGHTPAGAGEVIRSALAAVSVEPFRLRIRGVGQFPFQGRPEVVWARVEPNRSLTTLCDAVEVALSAAVGYRPEDRPWTPHVTLGWVGPNVGANVLERLLDDSRGPDVPDVPVTRFALYSSAGGPTGGQYRIEAAYPLTGAAG